jgi:hypothetical protein
MKRLFLLLWLAGGMLTLHAQTRPVFPRHANDKLVPVSVKNLDDAIPGTQNPNPLTASRHYKDDPDLGVTRFDKQTNSSCENRLYRFPDGTIGTTYTISHTDDFNDRGTGYNYFNGTAWGAAPASRIETLRTGWPSYAPFGATGEIVVAHQKASLPLIISTRTVKGTGAWTQTIMQGPAGAAGLDWPRVITNGPDHTWIHLIAITGRVANGGSIYNGLDGALVYNRSLNGGVTWSGWTQLDGMTSSEYLGFNGDTYNWAQPRGDTLAFAIGDSWNDFFIMKSTDNGATWTKKFVWHNLYNLWAGADSVPRFYCPDGSLAVELDHQGITHVVFGLQRASGAIGGGKYWVPFNDGLIYWNESMAELPQDLLPDTLVSHGNYIGYVQDTMTFYAQETDMAWYYLSMSSMPSMAIDDQGRIFVAWSGVTNMRDASNFMLRHIFGRTSLDNGNTWCDTIVDLTGNFVYNWSECVFPSMSPTSDDKIYLLFMSDAEAGIYQNASGGAQGQSSIDNNDMILLAVSKDQIVGTGRPSSEISPRFRVSQNYPNPASGITVFDVRSEVPSDVMLDVYNSIGNRVLAMQDRISGEGVLQFRLNAGALSPGIYLYRVMCNGASQTKRMEVQR